MRREAHDVATAAAVRCGDALVIPVVRVDVSCMAEHAYTAEAGLVGMLLAAPDQAPRWLPLAAAPDGAPSWDEWLESRPQLLADLRARLRAAASAP